MSRPLLTLRQARVRLNVGDSTIRDLVTSGRLAACQVGRQWRVDAEDLETFIEQRKAAARGTTVTAAVEQAFDADEHLGPLERVFS